MHECVRHVQKRMLNHLKALKKSNSMDSDGRHITKDWQKEPDNIL